MTQDQISQARKMRASGQQWALICQFVGENYHTVRRAIDPLWAQSRRDGVNEIRNRRRVPEPGKNSCGFTESREPRNPDYDPRRDGVLEPQTLSQIFLGDPLPGRSALDKKIAVVA